MRITIYTPTQHVAFDAAHYHGLTVRPGRRAVSSYSTDTPPYVTLALHLPLATMSLDVWGTGGERLTERQYTFTEAADVAAALDALSAGGILTAEQATDTLLAYHDAVRTYEAAGEAA